MMPYGPTMVQPMACSLFGASHCLDQCWIIVNWNIRNKLLETNFNDNTKRIKKHLLKWCLLNVKHIVQTSFFSCFPGLCLTASTKTSDRGQMFTGCQIVLFQWLIADTPNALITLCSNTDYGGVGFYTDVTKTDPPVGNFYKCNHGKKIEACPMQPWGNPIFQWWMPHNVRKTRISVAITILAL